MSKRIPAYIYGQKKTESDIVTIKCYGKEEKMERAEAIEYYREGVENSDGSERERYMEILMDLYDGKDYCSDKD